MSGVEVVWDPELGEWSRRTDDHLLGVSAGRSDPAEPGVFGLAGVEAREPTWAVFVSMAEFVRSEPLESEMRSSVDRALRDVPGVASVWEEDRECWALTGEPHGDDLVRAVGEAIDQLAPAARAHLDSLEATGTRGLLGRITSWVRLPWRRR